MPSGELSPQSASCIIPVLDAAGRLAAAPDAPSIFLELVTAAHQLLGFSRVCCYSADTTGARLLKQAVAPAQDAETLPAVVPLTKEHLLGRIALGEEPPGVFPLRFSEDAWEVSPEHGALCCVLPAQIDGDLFGLLIAESAPGASSCDEVQPVLHALLQYACVALKRIRFERYRDRFISSVSHELRTPLTSIRAFAEMLNDGDAGRINAKQRRFVDRISSGADRLQRIVEDLLTLSRLRLGAVKVEQVPVRVPLFLHDTALNFQPQAIERNIEVIVEASDDLPVIFTDPDRLQQALSNLVDNAIKFSPDGAQIRLSATRQGDDLCIAVQDNGPGIPREEQPHIFQEFYRVEDGIADVAKPGSGLGLTIVSQLADLLGAAVEVKSAPGMGSTFSLLLRNVLTEPAQ